MDTGLLADALAGFGRRLEAVDPDQWHAVTPCADWDVSALVNHVVAEVLWVPPMLEGQTIADVGDRFDGDILGDDALVTWSESVADALAATTQPGAQDRTVHLSFGDFPGGEYLGQVTSDVIIHSWDLARAVDGDDRLAAPLIEFVDGFLGPQIDAWRSAGAFGAAADVRPDADLQDRVLAHTGRSPTWSP